MSSSNTPPAGAPCWICLEEGPDDNGEPLMRGCSCRGDSAGFAHVACVADYARRKSDEAYDKAPRTGDYQASDIPWTDCPNCKQRYTGEMALAIANVRFEIIQAEGIPETDYRYVSTSFFMLARARFNLGDLQGAKELRERGLEVLRANPDVPYSIDLKIGLLYALANTLLKLSDSQGILDCFYEMRDIASRHAGYAHHLQDAEVGIAAMEAKIGRRQGDATIPVSYSRSEFEAARRKHGKQSSITLTTMLTLARVLANVGKISEALDILEEGLKVAKRVLGSDHQTTRSFEQQLHEVESIPRTHTNQDATLISDDNKLNGKKVKVLRATKDGKKYIITFEAKSETNKVKVPMSKLAFATGTPVLCQGLVSAQHLNGRRGLIQSFDNEKGQYQVVFYDNALSSCLVKAENLEVMFY